MSQLSTCSARSSIPESLCVGQDEEFICELEQVNEIYFANIQDESNVNSDSENSDFNDESDIDENNVATDVFVNIYERDIDRKESETVSQFQRKGCGCQKIHGKPCSEVIDFNQAIQYRDQCKEMTADELDLTIKVQLSAHRRDLTHWKEARSKKQQLKDRERVSQEYFVFGIKVCRETFMFCHGISKNKLAAIALSLDNDGLKPRTHGNTGKMPKHALSVNDIEQIVNFLTSYANANGLPLPGRLPNHRHYNVVLLPSDKSKADIHILFNEAAQQTNLRSVSLSEFKKIWLQQCPNIMICKPATDLCAKCQVYAHKISNSGNFCEEEKTELLENYRTHLDKAKCQRDYYREKCEAAKASFSLMTDEQKLRGQLPCSYPGVQQYSFDFAQQIFYPHYAQQVGPLFFKTPRKCQCFGVCSEGAGTQIFYLIDEAECTGKGANCVTSLLHHHFKFHGFGEQHVQLQMDNCSGQNKNNTVLWYGLWRTMTGGHRSVEYSLMEAGHTKFNPDWHFGLFKAKWRHCTVETLDQVAACVLQSSKNRHNVPQLVKDPEKPVIFYDWSVYLSQFFRIIPSLKKYHHFYMSSDKPGVVLLKEYATDIGHEVNVMKKNALIPNGCQLPEIIEPKGLDPSRQWYLYDEIRQFCLNSSNACPKPLVPKPSVLSIKTENEKRKKKCAN